MENNNSGGNGSVPSVGTWNQMGVYLVKTLEGLSKAFTDFQKEYDQDQKKLDEKFNELKQLIYDEVKKACEPIPELKNKVEKIGWKMGVLWGFGILAVNVFITILIKVWIK